MLFVGLCIFSTYYWILRYSLLCLLSKLHINSKKCDFGVHGYLITFSTRICNKFHIGSKCEIGTLMKDLKDYKWWWPSLPVTFIKCHVLSFTSFSEKVGNRNKLAPHIEVSFHKMGDITHFLDDVTHFSQIKKMNWDRYMELGP